MMRAARLAGPLLVAALAVTARADVVELSPSKDNTLYENAAGSLSNGIGEYFFAGRSGFGGGQLIRRGLIAFDVAGAIPPGSTINSVTLDLHVSRVAPGSPPQSYGLHRVMSDWGEGNSNSQVMGGGQGAQAQTGDATWVHTFFDSSRWDNVGGDFAAGASATVNVAGVETYTWNSTPQLEADVQRWLDDPAANFGWLVHGNETAVSSARRFDSRENGNAAFHPRLTVDFTLPITDCNGNGIDDAIDIANGTSEDCNDNGVPDECDDDRDGDGVIDDCDGCPDDANKSEPGVCGCGNADDDRDGDGVLDCLDDCPDDPNKSDPGACGCGNADVDSDGDGVFDCDDICPGQNDFLDSDGDGVVDCLDGCPLDPDKTQPGLLGCGVAEDDSDADGVPDSVDKCPGQDDNEDADGDGRPDCLDDCPNDPDKTEPGDCGCGESESDSDDDGIPDCIDNCPATFNPEQTDSDQDGAGDACDDDPSAMDEPDDGDADMPDDDCMRVEPDMMPECGGDLCGWGVMPMMPLMFAGMGWARVRRGRGRRS